MSSKLLFTQSSPLDTILIYEATGRPLYEIETENGTIHKTTVVRKLDLSTQGPCFFYPKEWGLTMPRFVSTRSRGREHAPYE
jgi:hypothetical protein